MSDEDAALARDAVRTPQPTLDPRNPDGQFDDDDNGADRAIEDDDGDPHPPET